MIKKTVSTLSILLALTLTPVASATAANVIWDMPNEYPATSIQGKSDKLFSKLVEEKTQGQIKIAHHFGGSLGFRSKDQLDAVGDGIVPLANTFIPPLGGIDPVFLLSSLPFVSSNAREARLLFEAARPQYDRILKKFNQRLLYSSPWVSSGLWGKKPFQSLEDIQNLKMRTYDANGTKVFRITNSEPLQLSWADIVPQLSTGGIEGVLTSIEAGLSSSFADYLTHFSAINYDSTINLVTINEDVWNNLPPKLQDAITSAAKETEDRIWTNTETVIQDAYSEAEQRGVTVIKKVPENFRSELINSAQPVIDGWIELMGDNGKEIISRYRASIKSE